jgi:SAM-dependent methyltransferase
VGLDVDEATVEKASLRYGSARCGFRHFAGDRTPFDACVFDIVVSFQVIEHVRDDGKFVTEVHRVLKPGGRFLVTTPNKTHRLKPGERPWNPFHVREYCPDELRTLLEAGFACVDVWGIRATDEIQRIERGRVARGRVLRRLDSLHLRRLLPRPWKRAMRRVLFGWREGYANAEGRSGDFRRKYHLADFRIMQQDLEDSLDLLGVCRKEG